MGHALFDHTGFNSDVEFTNTNFKKLAFFNRTEFAKKVSFFWSRFCDKTVFSKVKFKSVVCFDNVEFDKYVEFVYIVCPKGMKFNTVFFKQALMTMKTSVPSLHFVQCTNGKVGLTLLGIELKECFFLYSDMTNVHFLKSYWSIKDGRYHISSEDSDNPEWQAIRDFYQSMKRKYKAENNEYEASKWHIAEKEAQLKLLRQNGESRLLCFALWLYKLVSGFGENPVRAFWVLLGLIVLPLLVLLVGACMDVQIDFFGWTFYSSPTADVIGEWLKFIPLTRAIKGTEPSALRALMFLWQLLITVQAALFAFALRNRFRR
ncbi:hypothetical protein DWB63_09000 [Pseudodesulfovibrio sp. S3]|nr:hypothetical protein DWB63_09000 [Pseudodesulfovibrio sp. S3]